MKNKYVSSVKINHGKIIDDLYNAIRAYRKGNYDYVKQVLWMIIKAITTYEQAN